MKLKRFLSCVLCAVMVIALLPAIDLSASALEKSQVDVDAAGTTISGYLNNGTFNMDYYEKSYMRSGISSAMFVNGELNTKAGTAPQIPYYSKMFVEYPFKMKIKQVDRVDRNFLDSDGTEMKDSNGQPYSINSYNMFALFGKKGEGTDPAAAGFTSNMRYVNSGGCSEGTLTFGAHDGDLDYTSAKVTIKDNPTLKALAESGDLSFYFSGLLTGATASGCDDGESRAQIYVYLNGSKLFSTDYTVSTAYMSTRELSTAAGRAVSSDGYIPLQPNDTIEFKFYAQDAGCDGWANANIGLTQGLLLFRKTSSPSLTGYVLDSNGDRQSLASGITEVHLRGDGWMNLQFNFSEPVMTGLSYPLTMVNSSGQQLMELASHKLFNNTEGTGYQNQGEPVYMNLFQVTDMSNTVKNTTSDKLRFNSLKAPLKSLTYRWEAGDGDFYGDNALPNDGDWAGDISSSNVFNLIDKIVLASFHDLAGNPLVIQGVPYTYESGHSEIPQSVLTGTVNLNGGYTKSGIANPFAASNTTTSGYDFIIDAITPTYSRTSNAVQPEILTDLVLNDGDSFDVALNYSKTVKLRKYFLDGTLTGYEQNKLELLFNNGMSGRYKSGLGTKKLIFTVEVPADDKDNGITYNMDQLEIVTLRVPDPKNAGGYVTEEVLTDYVGNPLLEPLGDPAYKTDVAWSNLSVDNTSPVIAIERAEGVDAFRVNVTDNADVTSNGALVKSGVYHVSNATSDDLQAGLFYYTWIKGEQQKDQAIQDLSANNYELVKKYSLGVSIADSGYKLNVANNGALIDITDEIKTSGGDWFLVVITADMTWDSARQLIQYQKANYKNQSGDYLRILLSALGLDLDGGMFELSTSKPSNWSEVYTNYYTQVGSVYVKVNKGKYYPDFDSDTYYKYEYQLMTGAQPDDWEENYTTYFLKTGEDEYSKVPASTGVPTWRSNTFYSQYELVTSDPGDIGSNAGNYYLRKDGEYITALENVAPAYTKDRYYSSANESSLMTSETAPDNWASTFQNYYTKGTDEYPAVEPVDPEWEADLYYQKLQAFDKFDPDAREPLADEPANWDSCYSSFYVWEEAEYEEFESKGTAYVKDTYYKYDAGNATYTKLSDEEKPSDWEDDGTVYYELKKQAQFSKVTGTTAPAFAEDTYYSEYSLLAAEPANWDTCYSSYYVLEKAEYEKFESKGTEYVKDAYYEYDAGNETYTKLSDEEKPSDWEDEGTVYYKLKKSAQFSKVTGTKAPVFAEGTYYSEYSLLTAEPDDWDTNFENYYKMKQGNGVFRSVTKAPKFKVGTHYSAEYVLQTGADEPSGWRQKYAYYYTKSGGSYKQASGPYIAYEKETYYDKTDRTLLTSETAPADWDTDFASYYIKSGSQYIKLGTLNAPEYSANTYYLKNPVKLNAEPDDWDDNFEAYYEKIPGEFTKISDQVAALLKYESDKYYKKTALTVMNTMPSDWSKAYMYYFNADSSAVTEELFPPYEPDKYYGFLPKELTEEPDDWTFNYKAYVYYDGEDYVQALVTPDNRKENVPEYKENYYYSAASGIATLADKLSSAERKNQFMADLLSASDSIDQINAIRNYYEFASEVHAADVKLMSEFAANYSLWSNSSFRSNDSNWTTAFVKSAIDVVPPEAEYQSTAGDDSEDPTVTVLVTDANNISQVEYQFVEAGTEVTDETETGWVLADLGETPSASLTLELKAADYNNSYAISAGEYDLYLRTKDILGNLGVSAKVATVKYNPTIETTCTVSEPEGYAPYAKLEGLTATLSGVVNGKSLLDSSVGLKVYAAWDENSTKTDSANWTELTGTAGVYAIPTLQKVEGFYFLHIKYTFTAGGNTETKYVNQSYMVAGLEAEPVFNIVGSTDEELQVEITAVNADQIYWQLLENIETELTVGSSGWTELTGSTVTIKKADHSDAEFVRIWAKNGETISSEVFSLNANAPGSGALPTPTVGLADVYQDATSGDWYAIVRLTMDESLLAVGAEYSWAVSDAKAAVSSVTWQRWMPYEDTVRVKLGESNTGKRLLFKFRNGDNVTAEDDYQVVNDFTAPDGKPWAIVSRSTLQPVGVKDGVSLQFTCKEGYELADAADGIVTAKANGVFTYVLTDNNDETTDDGSLTAVISNIDITPPGFSLEWADGGNHAVTSGSVLVTLKPTEDVRITDVTFTSKKDGKATRAAQTTYYTFQENGSVTFTFCDAAGNETKATAKVTWIDNSKPEFTISEDYSAYQKVGKIASGVRLILQPTKVDSFVSAGTDGEDVFYLDVTQNGNYTFSMGDSLGNYVTKTYVVSNLVTGQQAPVQTETSIHDGKVFVTVSGKLEGYAEGNRLYDGQSDKCAEVTCDAEGNYTITRAYSCNGEPTAYICDSLGYVTPYKMKVDGLDSIAPTIKLPEAAITIAKGGTIDKNWWINSSGIVFSDNINTAAELTITTDSPITTSIVGAYSVILTAKDTSGNKAYARTTVYVLPVNAMAVTSDKGVLFASESKDAALIDTNTIRLKISNFELMKFGVEQVNVRNLAATCTVIVKQGIFREGQMKYFETKLRNLTFQEGQNYCSVLLDTNVLPGAGWYTIVVRNSEREREFTTFFVNP